MELKGLEKTQALARRVTEIMNTNPVIQGIMTELAIEAEAKGMSAEEWQKGKEALFSSCFFKLLLMDDELRAMVAEEYGNLIWNEVHGIA